MKVEQQPAYSENHVLPLIRGAVAATALIGVTLAVSANRNQAFTGEDELEASNGRPNRQITMLVEGDSIEAIDEKGKFYDDTPGSLKRVWLGKVEDRAHIVTYNIAAGGSGYLRQGNTNPRSENRDRFVCKDINFNERLSKRYVRKQVQAADIMGIFGGLNDTVYCNKNDEMMKATKRQIQEAVTEYMDGVLELRTAAGHDPRTTIVGTPYPIGVNTFGHKRVVPIIHEAALAHGFTWVDLDDVLNTKNTIDGIHPDYEGGTDDLARAFIRRSHINHIIQDIQRSRSLLSQ